MTFRDGYLDQSHENWGVLRGDDPQLNLNNPRMKIEIKRGIRECWKLTSACTTCNSKYIMA